MRSPTWGEAALGSCDLERIDAVTALVNLRGKWGKQRWCWLHVHFVCAAQSTHVLIVIQSVYVYIRCFLAFDLSVYCDLPIFYYIPNISWRYLTQVLWFQNHKTVLTVSGSHFWQLVLAYGNVWCKNIKIIFWNSWIICFLQKNLLWSVSLYCLFPSNLCNSGVPCLSSCTAKQQPCMLFLHPSLRRSEIM